MTTIKEEILNSIEEYGIYVHFPDKWEMNSKDLKELEDSGIVMSLESKFKNYLNSSYIYTKPEYIDDLYIHHHTEYSTSIRRKGV